jgi:hypothetical protein
MKAFRLAGSFFIVSLLAVQAHAQNESCIAVPGKGARAIFGISQP